jgi:transposase-like protein
MPQPVDAIVGIMDRYRKRTTAMNCPHCQSTDVHGPSYAPSGKQRSAIMYCRACHAAFDAYEWFGAGSPRR